jgi:hypothetical protein
MIQAVFDRHYCLSVGSVRPCTVTSHFLRRSSFFTFIILKIRLLEQRQHLMYQLQVTTPIQQGTPKEAKSSFSSTEIVEAEVNYHDYKSKNFISISSQINPIHAVTTYSSKIHINIIHSSRPRLSERILFFRFSQETLLSIFLSH